MSRLTSLSAILASSLVPSIAFADSGASTSGTAGIITAIAAGVAGVITAAASALRARSAQRDAATATVTAATATATAVAATVTAAAADERARVAADWADRVANAHSDGVVLVLSYPGTVTSCRGLLEVNGWHIQHYQVTQAELDRGALLPGPHVVADVSAADAIVVEGLDEAGMARLAGIREFRDNIRSGAGVAMYTGGRNYRYDLTLWGECDQGVTMPVTTEGAVRASLARREATARRQGIRPGQMALARQALIGQ